MQILHIGLLAKERNVTMMGTSTTRAHAHKDVKKIFKWCVNQSYAFKFIYMDER